MDDPRIGIALGGGAARGLAHIPFIEAMDELGLRPDLIAGTSIGALLGSGWAAGLSGRDIRELAYQMLGTRNGLFGRLLSTQFRSMSNILREGISIQLDPEQIFDTFTPDGMAETFETLAIPFVCVATDFKSWHQVPFNTGPLRPAVAGSLAVPSLFKPVSHHDTLLVDGGVVNPLPLDLAGAGNDILIGIDVSGDPRPWPEGKIPTMLDIGFGSAQIMMHQMIANMIAAYPPDLYFRPHHVNMGAHEYWRVREIVAAGDAEKDRFKYQLSKEIEMFIASQRKIS
ncbi:patatin-like phospholipase family protein [Pelagibacterium lacus]|uniref:Patatin-like phospholipase family protein n=1 Tax=Pelagibacterium lacus TaxID=2282655 RepID=A0A369W9V0_9HYPH|nr:patatin-like phospholipase family protein [Pelagibacterium lacus]RDE10645.1 patatin-like phospholipase family protein [Pelagibacterium lacus]